MGVPVQGQVHIGVTHEILQRFGVAVLLQEEELAVSIHHPLGFQLGTLLQHMGKVVAALERAV